MAFALAAAPAAPPAPQAAAARQFELKAETPKFWELIAQDAKLEKIAGGFGFTEGPVWDPKGFLYVSDEEKNKLSRVYPDGRVETMLEIGDPDGSTLDAQGPPGHHGERPARHHPGGSGRQVQGARR